MSEEIIIDGVNVYWCTYSKIGIDKRCYCEEHLYDDGTPVFKCKEEKNCYFKQLQRLKQENERLQMLTCANCGEQFLSPDGAELYEKNVQLQEENEQLKNENSHKSCLIWYIFHCSKVETIQRLLYEYYECINDDRYNEKRVKKFWDDVFHLRPRRKYKSKYKQALEEIKEIAEVSSLNTYWTILNNCENCHDNNECGEQSPIAKLKFIKDKIDEVLNESITNNNAD